jgi:hypothetical protein
MTHKRCTLVAALTLMTSLGQLSAQRPEYVQITGMVYDQKRRAIENAQVFLAYTALGAATRRSGMFTIKDVPSGTYDLYVYKKGYRMSEFTFTVDAHRKNNFNFRLKSGPVARTTDWSTEERQDHENKVKKFKEALFSTTSNSYECTITNPEVLEFPGDDPAIFKAVAQEPLIFENRALGYRVTYFLREFESTINFTKYHGIPKFEELTPLDGEEAHKWRLNRLKAFRGSPAHFFASVHENYAMRIKENKLLKEEGFVVSEMRDLRHEADEPYNLPTGLRAKSKQVDVNNYITPGSNPTEFQLRFDTFWEIIFTNELEEPEYLRHQGINPNVAQRYERVNKGGLSDYKGETYSGNLGDQKSLIKLSSGSITVTTTGNYYDLPGVQVFDYWSWQGLADVMPREYTLAVARLEEAALARYLNQEN